ncbi:MAG: hypothetical protein ACOC2F_06460 [Bacteroidota bacterium]
MEIRAILRNTLTCGTGDVAGVTDYPGSTSQVGGYTYDGNGNLTQETNKLMNFNYNLLNLPREVNYWAGANAKIKYYYTFDGEKLRKTVENNGIVTKVDYCGPGACPDLQNIMNFDLDFVSRGL